MAQLISAAVVMRLALNYVRASLVYMVVGLVLIWMSLAGIFPVSQNSFFFMQLYGFVAMMIFGVSYLFVPAFAHTILYSLRLAKTQFWFANLGVVLLTISLSARITGSLFQAVLNSAMLIELLAVVLHALNIFKTISTGKKLMPPTSVIGSVKS